MISHKKLVGMARKWRQRARADETTNGRTAGTSPVACKGHIVLYTMDGKRFMVPVSYLSSNIFRELLDKAEELFGLPSGPITLPCDADFMQQVVSSHRQGTSKDIEKALLNLISTSRCPAAPPLSSKGSYHQHQMLCGS